MADVHHLANPDDVSPAVVVSVVDRDGQVMRDMACLMQAFSGLDVGVREDHGLQLRLDHRAGIWGLCRQACVARLSGLTSAGALDGVTGMMADTYIPSHWNVYAQPTWTTSDDGRPAPGPGRPPTSCSKN